MAYLMHDSDHATTSDRVAWTHTHNLASDDPELSWKTMAATAMSQAELKEEAGIKNTGRKSNKHVMHYTLSWHDEERKDLTRDEMVSAALASMTYIGTHEGERVRKHKKTGKVEYAIRTQHADQHQAIVVCHDELNKSPHVHVMLNRVHPEHGVFVPDTYEQEKLSVWALEYRKAQGKEHYCPLRQINAAKKARGLITSHRRKSRIAYEAEQAQKAVDPGSRKAALLEIQRRRAGELKTKTEAMNEQHSAALHKLEDQHIQIKKQERLKAHEQVRKSKDSINASYDPKIHALTERHQKEVQAFRDATKTALGRVRNTWEAFRTKLWMTEIRSRPLHATTQAFKLAFDSGLQQRNIEKHHAREQRELNGEHGRTKRQAAQAIRADEQLKLADHRDQFEIQRNDLILTHDMEQAKLKAEWKQLQNDRVAIEEEDGRPLEVKQLPAKEKDQQPLDNNQPSPNVESARDRDNEPQKLPDIQADFEKSAAGLDQGEPPDDGDDEAREKQAFIQKMKDLQQQKRERELGDEGQEL